MVRLVDSTETDRQSGAWMVMEASAAQPALELELFEMQLNNANASSDAKVERLGGVRSRGVHCAGTRTERAMRTSRLALHNIRRDLEGAFEGWFVRALAHIRVFLATLRLERGYHDGLID